MRITVLFLVISLSALGVEFNPKFSGQIIKLEVNHIELPETISKSLKSGFTNILIFEMTLWKNGKNEFEAQIINRIVFDLWSETYSFQRIMEKQESIFKTSKQSQILEWLRSVNVELKLNSKTIDPQANYEASIKVVVDPISKEKREKIKVWLSENRVHVPGNSFRGDLGSKSNAREISQDTSVNAARTVVFNQILDAELNKDESAGAWVFKSEKKKLQFEGGRNEK